MSIQGKITSLYTDKTMSEALLPRTNTKAITDDKGVNLNAILDQVAYVDTENSEAAVAPLNADTLAGFPADNYASKTYVSNKIAEAQFSGSGSGDIDLSGLATKDDIAVLDNAIKAIDYPVDSVNGKTGDVILSASDVGASPVITGAVSNLVSDNLNANIVPISNASGKLVSSNVTATELGYLRGVTSKIQTQLNNKQALIGIGQITGDLNDYEKLRDTVCWVNGNSVANSPTTNFAVVETWSNGGGIILQRATTINHNVARRMRYNNTWTKWEWENPPLTVGHEYRTTRRYNGKVVYCKLCDCGALVSSGNYKKVSLNTEAMTCIVQHHGVVRTNTGAIVSLPIYETDGRGIGYHIVGNESAAYMVCSSDGSNYTASYIEVWYTKD